MSMRAYRSPGSPGLLRPCPPKISSPCTSVLAEKPNGTQSVPTENAAPSTVRAFVGPNSAPLRMGKGWK